MTLKVQGIMIDPLNHVSIITFCDVLDDKPQINATMKVITTDSQTQAEIRVAIRDQAKALFEEAIIRLNNLSAL